MARRFARLWPGCKFDGRSACESAGGVPTLIDGGHKRSGLSGTNWRRMEAGTLGVASQCYVRAGWASCSRMCTMETRRNVVSRRRESPFGGTYSSGLVP